MQLRIRYILARVTCLAGGVVMIWTSNHITTYDRTVLPHPSPEAIWTGLLGIALVVGTLWWSLRSVPDSRQRPGSSHGLDVSHPSNPAELENPERDHEQQ